MSANNETSAEKSARRIAANKTRGGFVSQKERAESKGGRYSEGGKIVTVRTTGGKNYQVGLSETLSFTDSAKTSTSYNIKAKENLRFQAQAKENAKRQERQIEKSKSEYGTYGEASAPPLTQKQKDERSGFIKQGITKIDEGFKWLSGETTGNKQLDNLLGKNISIDRFLKQPDVIQAKDTGYNFLIDVAHDPFLLGNKAPTQKAIDLSTSLQEKRKETSSDLLIQGKPIEAISKEGFRGSFATSAAALLSPLGGKVATEERILAAALSREKQIINLEKKLNLEGKSTILPEQKIQSNIYEKIIPQSNYPNVKYQGKAGMQFKKPIKPKLTGQGEEVVLTGGGIEGGRAQPIFVTKFGHGKTTTSEYTPLVKDILSPAGAKIQGKLEPLEKKVLGAEKQFLGSDFRFTTNLKTGAQRLEFAKQTQEGKIIQYAKVSTTETQNILKEKTSNILRDIKKPKSVLGQTRAEYIREGDVPSRLTSTKINLGKSEIGGGGKTTSGTKQFTAQQEKLIKESVTPTTKQQSKPASGVILTSPQDTIQQEKVIIKFDQPQRQRDFSSGIVIPSSLTIPKSKQSEIPITIITPKGTTSQNQKKGLLGSLGFTDAVDYKLGTNQGKTDKVTLKITDDLTYKITTIPKQDIPNDPPPPPPPTTVPEEKIPEIPKIPIIPIIPPALSSRDYDSPSRLLGTTKGFYGNVAQDNIVGVFGKKPEIIYSEGRGLFAKQGKQKKNQKLSIDSKISFGIGTGKKKKEINILGFSPKKYKNLLSLSTKKQKPIKFKL